MSSYQTDRNSPIEMKKSNIHPPVLFVDEIYESLDKKKESELSSSPLSKLQWGIQFSSLIAITQLLSDETFISRLLHYHMNDIEAVKRYAVYVILKKFSEQPLGGNSPNFNSVKWICQKVTQYLGGCSKVENSNNSKQVKNSN